MDWRAFSAAKKDLFRIDSEKLLAAAVILACFVFPVYMKPIVDVFAEGTSLSRVYGFGAFVGALVALRPFFAQALKKTKIGVGKLAIAALVLVFLYGLAGHLLLVGFFGADRLGAYYSFDSRGVTSTQLHHNHALKTIFCPFVPSDDIDCARPLLPYLPWFYAPVGAVLWLAAVALCIAYYCKLDGAQDKVAYAIMSFSALRTSIDGGIAYTDSICLFMLAFFVLANREKLKNSLCGVAIGGAFNLYAYGLSNLAMTMTLPIVFFVYAASLFFADPKKYFLIAPAILIMLALISPIPLNLDRWQADPCVGVNVTANETVFGSIYTPCTANESLWCGNLVAEKGAFSYSGYKAKKTEVLIARGLAGECGSGFFQITSRNQNLDAPND